MAEKRCLNQGKPKPKYKGLGLFSGNGDNDHDCRLEVGVEECFAANNMDHVLRAVAGTLAADLGMGDALAGIEDRHGGLVADACRKTARTLVRNAAESVEHQVSFQ